MDGFTEAVERLVFEMETSLKKHSKMFKDGYLDLQEKQLMDENTKLCFKTKKSNLFTEMSAKSELSVSIPVALNTMGTGSSSVAPSGTGLDMFASSRWAHCTPTFSYPKVTKEDIDEGIRQTNKRKGIDDESAEVGCSDDEHSAEQRKYQKVHDDDRSNHVKLEPDAAEPSSTNKPKPRKSSTKGTPSTVGKNGLPRYLSAWRKAKGMREHIGRRVFVNPDGRPYKAKDNPVLGEDFFLEAADVIAYTEKRKLEHPQQINEGRDERDKATDAEHDHDGDHDDHEDASDDGDSDEESASEQEDAEVQLEVQSPRAEVDRNELAQFMVSFDKHTANKVSHSPPTVPAVFTSSTSVPIVSMSSVASPISHPGRASAPPRPSLDGLRPVPQVQNAPEVLITIKPEPGLQ